MRGRLHLPLRLSVLLFVSASINTVTAMPNALIIAAATSVPGYGAIPIHVPTAHIDFLVSPANECIAGVPGFGFMLPSRDLPLQS